MCSLSENASMRRKSFYFGNLALVGSWVLFVLALALAAWVPERVLSGTVLLGNYALLVTVLWAFYLITSIGSLVQSLYPDKQLKQWIYLSVTVLVLALALVYCALALLPLLVAVPLVLETNRSKKNILLGAVAGIGEFAGLCNTALLFLLLRALLTGEWDFAGVPLRCDIFLAVCGVLSLAGIFSRGAMLAAVSDEWNIKSAVKKPVFIIIYLVLVLSVAATVTADYMLKKKLEAVRAQAEKLFAAELSAAGLEKYYLAGKTADAEFYNRLSSINKKISKAVYGKRNRKKGGKKAFAKPTAAQLEQQAQAYTATAADRAEFNRMLAAELPKYPVKIADKKLINLKQPQLRIIRSAAFTLLMQMNYEPARVLEFSQAYFNLFHALDCGTAQTVAQQQKMLKFWCGTVQRLNKSKKINAAQAKQLQAFAREQAKKINIQERLKAIAYIEAVFAWDLYKSHGLTTISATGAFFKYDRAEALKSLINFVETGKSIRPDRSIAQKLMPGLDAFGSTLNEMQTMLNEL